MGGGRGKKKKDKAKPKMIAVPDLSYEDSFSKGLIARDDSDIMSPLKPRRSNGANGQPALEDKEDSFWSENSPRSTTKGTFVKHSINS